MKSRCVYCGKNLGTTRDHIPPKCFFEKPYKVKNMLTVPCCEFCRRTEETNDGQVRNIIISTKAAEHHRVVESQLADTRNRAIQKYGQLPKMVDSMIEVDLYSPEGDYSGKALAFNMDSAGMNSFLHRMIKGLLHSEKKSGFLPSKIVWRTNLNLSDYKGFDSGITRNFGDVFSYSVVFAEGTYESLWLLTFYERLSFLVHFHPA